MSLPKPLTAALQLSILEGSLYSIYWSIISGAIINGLMLALGASPFHLAVLNGLPLLSQVFGVPAAKMVQSHDIRKPLVLVTIGLSRLLWIAVPLVVVLSTDKGTQLWSILIIGAVSHSLHSAGAVAWLSWVSDLVPESIRGTYFGIRSAIAGFIGMVGLTVASAWVDRVKLQSGDGSPYIQVLLALMLLSVGFAVASWLCLYFQPVRKMHNLKQTSYRGIWSSLASANGRRIAFSWVSFAFAIGLTAGLYMPAMLQRFQISYSGVAMYGWIALSVSTIAIPFWGRLADSHGNTIVLRLAWIGLFWQPLLFALSPYDLPHIYGLLPWPIIIDAIVNGMFWPAFTLAQTNLVIGESPSETRPGLFASLSAFSGLVAFVAVILGGAFSKGMGHHTLQFGGIILDNIKLPMMLGAILRLFTGTFLFVVREPARKRPPISGGHAYAMLWRLVLGRPYRPVR
jgi:MFS family permease